MTKAEHANRYRVIAEIVAHCGTIFAFIAAAMGQWEWAYIMMALRVVHGLELRLLSLENALVKAQLYDKVRAAFDIPTNEKTCKNMHN